MLKSHPRTALALALAAAIPSARAQAPALDPVVVTAARYPTRISETLADATVITREEIARSAQTTLPELLRTVPGIQVTSTGGPGQVSGVFMRGANTGQTLLLVDGMRLASATVGTSAIEHLPLDQIERIEIVRGPASSLYGADAVGGVIQIFTRRGSGAPRVNASAGYGTYNTFIGSAGVSGQSGATRYALQAGYESSRGFSAIANPSNLAYNPDDDGYSNRSVTASVSHDFSDRLEVGARLFRVNADTQFDGVTFDPLFNPITAFDFRNRQQLQSLSAFARAKPMQGWDSTLRIGQSEDSLSIRGLDGFTLAPATDTTTTTQNQAIWQNDVDTPVGRFLAAAEYRRDGVNGTTAYAVTSRTVWSVLGGWQGAFGPASFQANVRYDDNSQFGGRTTGSLAAGYELAPGWRATAAAGTAFKAPSFNDLYFPFFGNPNLKPETSRNVEAGLRYERGASRASLVAYRNDVTDLITIVCDPFFIVCAPQNIGEARLAGVTLAAATEIADWSVSGSVDIARPENAATGALLPLRAKEYGSVRAGRAFGAARFTIEVVGSGQRYANAANTIPLAGYALVNLYGEYGFARDWALFAKLTNLFDREYEIVKDYGTAGRGVFVGVRFAPG
ncbi:MAG: TonB-dependent receptor [Burkholderiales bacterium]|jgi:vitamin B12 transporter|nr:TonB-dependent receptor [Burkholderiales bacterium]